MAHNIPDSTLVYIANLLFFFFVEEKFYFSLFSLIYEGKYESRVPLVELFFPVLMKARIRNENDKVSIFHSKNLIQCKRGETFIIFFVCHGDEC